MAMLAEKRQKVRWVLNPRQTAWSKDSNKFGQQYMEKLGWKAGQGIGANLQGCTEHVKVSVRSDNRGVGFKDIPEDVLPHQNNYSDLLAQLATNNPPAMAKADEGKSLELKSRQSRARVHYHKFTRSKDLTTYSRNDLACILGKSTMPTKSSVDDTMQNEPNFIHRGNMNAYFKEKSKSNYKNFIAEEDKFKEEEEDSLYVGFGFSQVIKDAPPSYSMSEISDSKEELNQSVNKSRKKHKTNDQRLDKPDSDFSIVDYTDTVQPVRSEQELNKSTKNSSRKRKKSGRGVELPENCFLQSDFRETVCPIDKEMELNQNIKTSKRKQRKVDQSVDVLESERFLALTDNSEVVQTLENDEGLSKTSKMSNQKLKKNDQSVAVPESCGNDEEFNVKIKKPKKKRKKSDKCLEVPEIETGLLQILCTETHLIESENESSVDFKKSKKKRKNAQCMEVPGSESCPQTNFIETVGLQPVEKEKVLLVSRSKNKQKENTVLSTTTNRTDLENVPINEETKKNRSSNHQPNLNKEKKKVKDNEMIIESQDIDTVEFMQKRQKPIKSVRFSDPLLNVLLIPSRDHLETKHIFFDNYKPENCATSLDLNVEKCNQTAKTPVNQDQPSTLTNVPCKPDVFDIHKTDNQSTYRLENIAKSFKIVVDGITYTNGISECNHTVPRRQKYSSKAVTQIPRCLRKCAFDRFPGSNVETLGYGEC